MSEYWWLYYHLTLLDRKERKNKSDEVSFITNYATKNDDERKKKAKQKEELFLTIDRVLRSEKPHRLSQTCYQQRVLHRSSQIHSTKMTFTR